MDDQDNIDQNQNQDDDEEESCKVVLLGESGVGKTSIISNLMEQEFLEDQPSTTGATFSTKTMNFDKYKRSVCFEIWDTAGQEKYRALTKMFYKDAAAAILVYDITRAESFTQLKEYWATQVKENAPKKIVLAIAANKSDLYEHEAVSEADGRAFAKQLGAIFRFTSCKNKEGVEELFVDVGNKFLDPNFDVSADAQEEYERIAAIKRNSVKVVKKKPEETNTNTAHAPSGVAAEGQKGGCC
ncbi:MAG: GTP-binding protein [archaeon]|nr:GTP-binding protein [archaeon]